MNVQILRFTACINHATRRAVMYLFIWLVDHDHIDLVWNTIISGEDRWHCIIVFSKFLSY